MAFLYLILMVKYGFSLIMLFVFSKSIACTCNSPSLDDSYRFSTNVISGVITDVSTYEKDETLLRITMDVYEEFKGSNLTEFYILDPKKAEGMCHLYLLEGQEILVYLAKFENGLVMTGYCSRNFPLKYLNKYPLELEILRKVKQYNLSYTSMFFVDNFQNEFFRQLSGIDTNESIPNIGIFEVEVDMLNYWTDARVIEGFGKDIDQKILELLKESKWELDNYYSYIPIPTLAKFFIVIENEYWETNDTFYLYRYNFF